MLGGIGGIRKGSKEGSGKACVSKTRDDIDKGAKKAAKLKVKAWMTAKEKRAASERSAMHDLLRQMAREYRYGEWPMRDMHRRAAAVDLRPTWRVKEMLTELCSEGVAMVCDGAVHFIEYN